MFRDILRGAFENTAAVFRGRNLLWHGIAIALTALFVLSGFDWYFYEVTRSPTIHPFVWLAGIGGFFVPVIVPIGIYFGGEMRKDRKLMSIGAAMLQAVIIASLVVIFYKAFTGRIQPEFMNTIGNTDISRDFQFGFLRHGVFWGWPSSHAAVASAGGVALFHLVRNRLVHTLVILNIIIVALGAAIGFHWFSDVIAGAIIGSLIGIVVAKSFGTVASAASPVGSVS